MKGATRDQRKGILAFDSLEISSGLDLKIATEYAGEYHQQHS